MNACTFCKNGKRKCDRQRPSCSNCVRLRRTCTYTEDTVETHFATHQEISVPSSLNADSLSIGVPSPENIASMAIRILGSPERARIMSTAFFAGTHQRIPALSRFRFYKNFPFLTAGQPRADFATLCLSMLLVQQLPSKTTSAHSPLYTTVKNIIAVLEMANSLSIDYLHCKILVTFYEMGHGLHRAAYLSVASCARTARVLGLNRKPWMYDHPQSDPIELEEMKRSWWSIVIMDRFINLCNGDDLFLTDDPERTDPLPIDDLLWTEALYPKDLHEEISSPPSLDTPVSVTVGQMARECQISNLVGSVVRHVLKPTPDPEFNGKEAAQLERTLRSYMPLLAAEELKIGKYCAAFAMCNSALYILYDTMLSLGNNGDIEKILQCIEDVSVAAINFAEASYGDLQGDYSPEMVSPYVPYTLCQTAIVQYRLWKTNGNAIHLRQIETAKRILGQCSLRWRLADQYLERLENLNDTWPALQVPHQGELISTRRART